MYPASNLRKKQHTKPVEENISELVKKGIQLTIDGNFEEALSYLDQAIIIRPKDPD